jgi:hypothetical protein
MSEGAEVYPPLAGPPQISHRKNQPGSLGIEEKISQASHPDSTAIRLKSENPDFDRKRM